MLRLLMFLALGAVQRATAIDVRFKEIADNDAVTPLDITVQYSNKENNSPRDYPSCQERRRDGNFDSAECPTLNWDDDTYLHIAYTFPASFDAFKTLGSVGGKELGRPVKYKIQACFETPFTKNRKWRKPKAIIQDDKRCGRKIASKRDLEELGTPFTFQYEVPSDIPKAEFFITIFIFCEVAGTGDNEYCSYDTTGPIDALTANKTHLATVQTSERLSYKTDVISSRPTELVICVIVLSILSVLMLILYFVYERTMKKTA